MFIRVKGKAATSRSSARGNLWYAALHGAGLRRARLMESNTAVFVGVMSTEFKDAVQHENAYTMTGTGHCFVSGRLSYTLGLHGACEAILTDACSSDV